MILKMRALLLLSCLLCLALADQEPRVKRQMSQRVSASSSASTVASSSSSNSGNTMSSLSEIKPSNRKPVNRITTSSMIGNRDDDMIDDESELGENTRPTNRPTRKRRPVQKVVASSADRVYSRGNRYDDNDDYCEDDYGDSRGPFSDMMNMATGSMRHMTRMMGNMFDRMPFRPDDIESLGRDGGNVASASASGNSNGYSQLMSSVSSNGRTRGIVSETRNGRTQTRRFGDQDDEADSRNTRDAGNNDEYDS